MVSVFFFFYVWHEQVMSHATSQTIRTETQAKKRLRLDPELAANLEEFDGLWTPERSGTLPQCMWVMIDVMKNRLWHDTSQNVRLVFNIKLLEYIRYLVELRLLKLRNDDAAKRGVVMGEEAKEALKKKSNMKQPACTRPSSSVFSREMAGRLNRLVLWQSLFLTN